MYSYSSNKLLFQEIFHLFLQEILHQRTSLNLGDFQIVIDDHFVEMLSLCKLILGTFDALINHFGSIGGTSFQTAAEFLDAG